MSFLLQQLLLDPERVLELDNEQINQLKSSMNTNSASSSDAKENIKKCQKEIEKLTRSQREL